MGRRAQETDFEHGLPPPAPWEVPATLQDELRELYGTGQAPAAAAPVPAPRPGPKPAPRTRPVAANGPLPPPPTLVSGAYPPPSNSYFGPVPTATPTAVSPSPSPSQSQSQSQSEPAAVAAVPPVAAGGALPYPTNPPSWVPTPSVPATVAPAGHPRPHMGVPMPGMVSLHRPQVLPPYGATAAPAVSRPTATPVPVAPVVRPVATPPWQALARQWALSEDATRRGWERYPHNDQRVVWFAQRYDDMAALGFAPDVTERAAADERFATVDDAYKYMTGTCAPPRVLEKYTRVPHTVHRKRRA
jgi:hypothetical protein